MNIISSVSLNIAFLIKIRVYQQIHGATNVYDDQNNITQFSCVHSQLQSHQIALYKRFGSSPKM